jgi:hypothetical protein
MSLSIRHNCNADIYTETNRRSSVDYVACDDGSKHTSANMKKGTITTCCTSDSDAKSTSYNDHEQSSIIIVDQDIDDTASVMSNVSNFSVEGLTMNFADDESDNEGKIGLVEYNRSTDDRQQCHAYATSSASTSTPKGVGFSTLTIREYAICLGDNVTSAGAPVTISWDYQSEASYSVEEYDDALTMPRRSKSQLQMPVSYREELLRTLGYSRKEIDEASRQSAKTRYKRRQTNQRMAHQQYDEFIEKVGRVGVRLIGGIRR